MTRFVFASAVTFGIKFEVKFQGWIIFHALMRPSVCLHGPQVLDVKSGGGRERCHPIRPRTSMVLGSLEFLEAA
jgi:hypothetical protein